MASDAKIEKKPLVQSRYQMVVKGPDGSTETKFFDPAKRPTAFARSTGNQLSVNDVPRAFNNPQQHAHWVSPLVGQTQRTARVGPLHTSGDTGSGTSIFASLDPNVINQKIEGLHAGFTQKTPPIRSIQDFT